MSEESWNHPKRLHNENHRPSGRTLEKTNIYKLDKKGILREDSVKPGEPRFVIIQKATE